MYASTRKQRTAFQHKSTYISSSSIQGQGLFASRRFSRGDVILDDLFPHKEPNEVLYNPISESKFNYYMDNKTSKLNHCSREDNAKVITSDYKLYQLVSIKDIPQDSEITVNYDTTNKEYPFIDGIRSDYKKC